MRSLPKAGFVEGVRAQGDKFGAVLIFDEIKTSFRLIAANPESARTNRAPRTSARIV